MIRGASLLVVAALAALAPRIASAGSVAWVDYDALIKEAPQTQASNKLLTQEFFGRQLQIEKDRSTVKSLGAKLAAPETQTNVLERASVSEKLKAAKSALQSDQSAYDTAQTMRQQQLLANLKDLIQQEIETYARAHDISVVLRDGELYAGKRTDITTQILARLQYDYAQAQTASGKTP
ncbi:MAG TPA: OmpH family outer membrane protein [Gammaproteobacteria bacterium]|nr:OmpH family outer membrane protein [Gammaproteobacteria bacterium]